MISSHFIEEVRSLADAVALIGAKVKLRKAGASYVGLCPFHEDREGSFRVYGDEKRFRCYGCGEHGDLFSFLERLERKPFPAVVTDLAAALGIVVPAEQVSAEERCARRERVRLLSGCEAAASHWQRNLWGGEGGRARELLSSRGVSEEFARSFRLGYALPEWHDLHWSLGKASFPAEMQYEAGLLATRGEGETLRFHDRFRGRIVFPFEDRRGRVVGFGGRVIAGESPKYLGTPETPLHAKGRSLYGLSRARETIGATGRAILVEGYFDVLVLHQAGFTSAVAAGGTTVSREQVKLLEASGCRDLVLLFDGDEAGSKAPARVAPELLRATFATSVACLGEASQSTGDPDSFVLRSGKASLEDVLAAARPLTEYLIDFAVGRVGGPLAERAAVEYRLAALRDLMPLLLSAPEGLRRRTFEKAVARRLHLDIGPLRDELRAAERSALTGAHA